MKRALITGITGQDGSYLAEFLLGKGYEVHGIVRACSSFNRGRIDHLTTPDKYTDIIQENPILWHGDLKDSSSIEKIIGKVKPDEIYNLAAQSHVRISFDIPEDTTEIISLGTLRLLEAMRHICPDSKFYQASSSEMFGKVAETPQTEKTPLHPRSPYACAKVHAHNLVVNYREAYGLHASNGILFNHESERRGENFVTRKITRNLTRIKVGTQKKISLGNLNAERDWGYSGDYVKAMWMMLQKDKPDDYVIGTGEKHSVREFLEEVARNLDMNIVSNGMKDVDEKYFDEKGNVVVDINPSYFRPTEVDSLLANSEKARIELGWEPKIKFKELARKMTEYDFDLAEKEKKINGRIKTF
jgi:GDPmannose 4,6-dehydratase